MAAEPRTTMARRVASPSQTVSSCSVPMTLTSCSDARGRPGSGNWTMSLWTTRVDRGGAHERRQLGAAQVGRDDVDALGQRGSTGARVDPDDTLDAGVAGQQTRRGGRRRRSPRR